jgi:hypothetical protein
MDGITRLSAANLSSTLNVADGTGWHPVGVIAQDGEHPRDDIVWHNDISGQTQVWLMNGLTRTMPLALSAKLDVPASTGWRIVALDDFDADGTYDIVWHNGPSGAMQTWFMNPDLTTRRSVEPFATNLRVADNTGWRVVGGPDVNLDGYPDLLWHNGQTGETQVWYLVGTTRIGVEGFSASLNVTDGSGWRPFATDDYNRDGKPDLMWHNGLSGESQVWYLDGVNRIGAENLPASLNVTDRTGWLPVSNLPPLPADACVFGGEQCGSGCCAPGLECCTQSDRLVCKWTCLF